MLQAMVGSVEENTVDRRGNAYFILMVLLLLMSFCCPWRLFICMHVCIHTHIYIHTFQVGLSD